MSGIERTIPGMGRIDVAIRADRTKANALHRGISEDADDEEEQEEDDDEQDEQSDDGEGYSE